MAKSKKATKLKSSKRAQNALELAQREIDGYSSSEERGRRGGRKQRRQSKRRDNVVNLLKKSQRGGESEDDDEDSGANSFEDEEIDSDEAFGSDEDLDVLNSKFSQTIRDAKKKNGQNQEIEIDEEEGYTSIEEEDLMSLSQVWDMDEKSNVVGSASDEDQKPLKLNDDDNLSSGSNSSSEEDSSDNSNDDENVSEDDPFDEISADEEDLELNTITDTLKQDVSENSFKKLEDYGTGEVNEYNLPNVSGNRFVQKISLQDMMSVIDDKTAVSKASLIRDENSSTLAIPLPQRIQKRHDRKAAYEISKDEVNAWKDVVSQNRRADHLSFPLNPEVVHNNASTFTDAPKETQSNLQQKVSSLLEESNLVDLQKESKFEDLATAKMSPEEMKKRTTELRLMRELMFREERKAKRVKKIKSKAYHRIKKKELMKNQDLAGLSDDEDDDVKRAKERMTLKHKSSSKWAKDMIKHGMSKDSDTREEIEEMFRQGERLKEKILDRRNSEDDDEYKTISDLERDDESDDDFSRNVGKTGVMNMSFMKNAEAKEREENRKNIEKLRSFDRGEKTSLFESDDENENTEANVVMNAGRRIYTPGNLAANEGMKALHKDVLKEQEIDEVKLIDKRLTEKHEKRALNSGKAQSRPKPNTENSESETLAAKLNPWLDIGDEGETNSSVKHSSKISIIDKDSSKQAKSLQKMEKDAEKHSMKSSVSKKRSRGDDLLLNMEESNKLQIVEQNGSDAEDATPGFMFKQQDVIAEAFAGDDVVAEFEEEKRRVEVDEDDKELDVTLPGWGEWAGAGAATKKRKFIKKVKGVVSKDKRRDKQMKNVIINEKVNKKNLKFQSSAVPFPFENKEQYERSLRMPLGQEWTSRASHQKMIKPRISVKPGQVIDPLKAPFK